MEFNPYQIPQNNDIYVQQNLVTAISPKKENDNFNVLVEQSFGFKKILNKNILPITTEIGLDLNHYFQSSLFCSSSFQNFYIDSEKSTLINNFWYCGNAFTVIPYAASIFHPKIKIYGGAGQAYGTQILDNSETKSNVVLYFWTLKPVLFLETNVSEKFKFSLGGGYQFVFSDNSKNLATSTSGFEALASISFHFN
ncbi:hypothetical protein [Silvanigrella aquatica]|uniref:Outer membrane protein beta-barrel domain-containing protein n=1 Tax=Silvanigrella aquatica TaxID=1915309 RepID=A0A1L4CZ25_9BACT|nr:hypothetical protein [Silvanigrella aquatica]APJ03201.1 hypothetical protein AXG55_04500 [Silvanigrella aquatica]